MRTDDRGRRHPGRLLLVCGDRAEARRLAGWLATDTHFDVTVAHDGRTGWVLSRARRWAAVICDADLPDFPGLELACQSKTLAPHVPTIFLVEHPVGAVAIDEITFAVDAVVRRPCTRPALRAVVARLVGEHALTRDPRDAGIRCTQRDAPAPLPVASAVSAPFLPARSPAPPPRRSGPLRWGAASAL